MNKKAYSKPVLAVRAIALGVFGTYGGPDGKGGGGDGVPAPYKRPVDVLPHME